MVTFLLPLELNIISSFKRLFQGQWHQWSVKKEESCCSWQHDPSQAVTSQWLCYKGFLAAGRPQPMKFNRHGSTMQDKKGHDADVELHPWSHLRAAAGTGPNASTHSCSPLHPVILQTQEELSIRSTGTCGSLWDSHLWQKGNRNMSLGAGDTVFQQELTIRLAKLCPAAAAGEPGALQGKKGA